MNPSELYRAGSLDEAIQALGVEVRDNPLDARRRTFLFELLCFSGSHDRAAKHLDVLAGGGKEAEMGTLLYRSALHAEQTRQEMFRSGLLPQGGPAPPPVSGTLNGTPFGSLADADPRIGARLELYAAGQYTWVAFEHVESVRMEQPVRVRDLLWIPAIVRTGPSFPGLELGEVLLPVLTPFAWQHADPAVRLGRATEWERLADGEEAPVGQKMLLVDGEEVPLLEVRELTVTSNSPVPA
jgi:type VI secretion system protein ImpE